MTETASCATVTHTRDRMTGRAGAPLYDVDIKLVNWDEGNYRVTDTPNPRGEVHVGGDNVAVGYFKNKEDLLLSIFEEKMDQLLEGLGEALADTDDPIERVRRYARFHFQQVRENRASTSPGVLSAGSAGTAETLRRPEPRVNSRVTTVPMTFVSWTTSAFQVISSQPPSSSRKQSNSEVRVRV